MNRRDLIALFAVAAVARPAIAPAQQPSRPPLVGVFTSRTNVSAETDAFHQAIRDLGYTEEQDISIVYRSGPAGAVPTASLPQLAREFVERKPDVIVTPGGVPNVKALLEVTSTIPIVMVTANDAVEAGLVASLARPGGNVTGLSWQAQDLSTKRLQLLQEVLPHVRRVAAFLDPSQAVRADVTIAASKALGLEVRILEISGPKDLGTAFETAANWGAEALSAEAGRTVTPNRQEVLALVAKYRLPAIYHQSVIVHAGGLMSYGPNFPDLFRRAALYVDKILKGAKPADLPVEQPTKFEFVVNLKAAQALGLTIPPSIFARADEVIE
ncbi:MAG: ABC transporter substrate-binding protein [Alphaproteobacteria bacterium]